MRLHLDIEGEAEASELPNGGSELAAFLSFANLRGFGATHPLIALADRLHDHFRVPMGPLTTFYGREVEDSEDVEKLEQAWQAANPLAEALNLASCALTNDDQSLALLRRATAEGLPAQVAGLLNDVLEAEARGKRVRLSFSE